MARTGVLFIVPEKLELRRVPDRIELIRADISETEFLHAEKEIAGIDRTVGHDAELCDAGSTTSMLEHRGSPDVWKKASAEDGSYGW